MSIKIAIIDDHKLFRQGLKELISRYDKEKKYEIIFEADDGNEMIEKIKLGLVPTIILMDINMPSMDGFQAVKWLKENNPKIMVAVMSMREDSESVIKMLHMGVCGYISKASDITDLKHALDAISSTGFFHSEFLSSHLMRMMNIGVPYSTLENEIAKKLSENERVFWKFACTEMTYVEIAQKMELSPKTIDSYRDSLFKKLNVKSRVGLVILGIKLGFCKID